MSTMTGRRSADRQYAVPFRILTHDGVPIGGFVWSLGDSSATRPVVVIASATSVLCRYYSRFADYLFANGFDVITFDYRGIGVSRPRSLRGFRADWVDWGEGDLEAVLQFAAVRFPNQPVDVVAHSIGGFAIGLAPSSPKIRRIFSVGAQYAYWRDYSPAKKFRMCVKWHVVMPLLTIVLGYFPGRRLGWMEDTPAGVVRDWSGMGRRFEETVRRKPFTIAKRASELCERFAAVSAPILAVGLDDDPNGTPIAIDRLLLYFTSSKWRHWRIAPSDLGVEDRAFRLFPRSLQDEPLAHGSRMVALRHNPSRCAGPALQSGDSEVRERMPDVRIVEPTDRLAWEALWHDNCAHFQTSGMAAEVVEGLWRRILDSAAPMSAWLALRDGEPVGLVHTILHPHTFTLKAVCYVEDIWVVPEARNTGVATAIIGHLVRLGEEKGWRRIYWQTDADNTVARRLYDKIARQRAAVNYEIDLLLPPDRR